MRETGKRTSAWAARYALLVALAMVLSWLESMISLPVSIPGVKVGLTNLVVIFALYRMSLWDAASISMIRVILVSMTFGNAYSLAYSFAGAVLSLVFMTALKKSEMFSILGVSIAGGIAHNMGQIFTAMVVLRTARLIWYLPALLIAGTLAGIAIGAAGGVLTERIRI